MRVMIEARGTMTNDEQARYALEQQALYELITRQRANGVPTTSLVHAIGLALGFGHLMHLAEQTWRDRAIQGGVSGTEFAVGPCARELVPCPHPTSGLDANGHCDWCCGTGRVTARVLRAIQVSDATVQDREPTAVPNHMLRLYEAARAWRRGANEDNFSKNAERCQQLERALEAAIDAVDTVARRTAEETALP